MSKTSEPLALARRGRWALAVIFLVNGFLVGSWAPQIPVFLTRLEISEFTLGLLILVFGLGALIAMPTCGILIGRLGSRTVIRIASIIASFGLVGVAAAPNIAVAAVALLLFGGFVGGMDVAMNANAVAVERQLRRAIMSSSHGFWSLGGFAGGSFGGLAIATTGHLTHAVIVTGIALVLVLAALPRLLTEERAPTTQRQKVRLSSLPKSPLVYLTGLVALFAMVPEGAVLDWAALYLRQDMGADIAVAGLAFAGFSGAMALMRFLGDGIRNRLGAVTTLRVSSLTAALAMFAASLSPSPWLAIVAFAVCGLGIANMVPIAFSAAGNQPGISSAAGMSVATTIGYSGILLAPSIVGFVVEKTGFAPVFIALSGLLFIVCLMAGLAKTADFAAAQPAE